MILPYNAFINIVALKSLSIQSVIKGGIYIISAFDGPIHYTTTIAIEGTPGADQLDFEANYLPLSNKSVIVLDSDKAIFSRAKQTSLGWTFQDHSFEFQCGTKDSLYSKDFNGNDLSATNLAIRFYKLVSGVETLITGGDASDQAFLTANCIKTVVDWEVPFHIDIMAGYLEFFETISTDVRLWVVAVPDIPAAYGGSKELLSGGKNLRYTNAKTPIIIDGRVIKHLVYDATYHTSKIGIILRHDAGFNAKFQMSMQIYKM